MLTNKMKLASHETIVMKLACGSATTMLVLLMSGLLLVRGLADPSFARAAQPQTPPRTFATPGEATSALFEAAQKQDEQALEAILCAGKDVTFEFLENVLTEVIALFPGEFIHIGGDEVAKQNWKSCLRC